MKRFNFEEMSLRRIVDALARRIYDIPHFLTWNSLMAGHNRDYLSRYTGLHGSQRCFILANGPSLASMDLSLLKNEMTIGLNRIYLLSDKLGFLPTYYVCVNELVLDQFSHEISALNIPKFLNWNRRNLFEQKDSLTGFIRLGLGLNDSFGTDMRRALYAGGTVTYVALQIAYIMGFSDVIVIGLDHSFADKGIPNKVEIRHSETDANHFHPDYFPKGSKWQLPDLKRSELAYALARTAYEKDGRRIVDATPGGKCDVFEKQDYLSFF